MVVWATIATVIFGFVVTIIMLLRRKHQHKPMELIGASVGVLGLMLAFGLAVQTEMDRSGDRRVADHRDRLLAELVGVVAEMQRNQSRTDVSQADRVELFAVDARRYNRIRDEIAQIAPAAAPAPIPVPVKLLGPPDAPDRSASGGPDIPAPDRSASDAPQAPASSDSQGLADVMLALHNRERAEVGVPGLDWDSSLAVAAAAYARQLAQVGRLEHAPREARAGAGENLAMGTQGFYSAAALAGGWASEKSIFVEGIFPNVTRAGARGAVGHYTQMVWRGTTSVGCGTATGGGNLYLVCRYLPPGNVIGRRVF